MIFLSIIVFFIIFSIVILVHEWGHFSSARRHGVHVQEFGLGMPPKVKTLWKDSKNCEYTFNWIPFGGFVRMEGEDEVNEALRKSNTSFASKPILARMEIVLAGVFMNFILAIGLLTVLFSVGAKPILFDAQDIQYFVKQGTIILDTGLPVQAVIKNGPAEKGGLRVGDKILTVNGKTISSAEEITQLQKSGNTLAYKVLREFNGKIVPKDLAITADENGKIQAQFPAFSIKDVQKVRYSIPQAFLYSLETSWKIAKATVKAFKGLIIRLVTKAEIPKEISGPVGIAAMTHGILVQGEIENLFKFIALLSLSLAIMNVLPIPALDGGRFLFLLVEAIFRKPIKPEWESKIHMGAYVLLLFLIVIVTGNDIYKLVISFFSA